MDPSRTSSAGVRVLGRAVGGVLMLVLAGLFLVVPASASAAPATVPSRAGFVWTQRTPTASPPPTYGQAMAYDARRQRVVMFGGVNDVCDCPGRQTWEWNGSTWHQRFPQHVPPGRYRHVMAYVPDAGHVVMFGGSTDSTGNAVLGDTWTWDGLDWTQRTGSPAPSAGPSARAGAGMATDPSGGAVLFSGDGRCSASYCRDTWAWSGTAWSRLRPSTSPPADSGHAMAYNASTRRVLLYSGHVGSGCCGRTWEWDGRTWTERRPVTLPYYNPGAGMAYDRARGSVVMFGSTGPSGNSTWEWDGSDWRERRPPQAHPRARHYPVLAPDVAGGVVLFGGLTSRGLSDTWTSD